MKEEKSDSDSQRPKEDLKVSDKRWFWSETPPIDRTKKVVISDEEVFALLEFAANYKAEEGEEKELIENLKALSKEIHKSEPDPSEIVSLYAGLIVVTSPVTGRTLIDSVEEGGKRLWKISVVTAAFFILAIGNSIAGNWIADIVEFDDQLYWLSVNWLDVKTYVWDRLTPFFYGALGSCVFVLKAVQDAAKDRVYHHQYMEGWGTRVLIGGILAAIVLILFDPAVFSADSLPLSSAAIAFLTGLGVKPVYGALEKTIELLSDKLNLNSIRRSPSPIPRGPKADTRQGDDGAKNDH